MLSFRMGVKEYSLYDLFENVPLDRVKFCPLCSDQGI